MSSGPVGVYATGIWDEGHVPYPPRSAYLPHGASEAARPAHGVQKSAAVKVAAVQGGERTKREEPNRSQTFDA